MHTIGQLCLSRQNNFDFIRFALAIFVIYTHSYDLTGQTGEIVLRLTNQQLPASGSAVALFFVISGFLVAQSWERSSNPFSYFSKRIRRIMPGFIAAVLFCLLIVGPLSATSLGEYLTDSTTYRFATLLCFKGPQIIPSVFKHNPIPGNINGSLWTIRLELICYVIIAVFGLAGLLRHQWAITIFAGLCIIADFWLKDTRFMSSAPLIVRSFPPLLVHFAIGTALYVWRNAIPLSQWLAALCVLALTLSCYYGGLRYTFPFFASYLLFFIAFNHTLRVHHFAENADLSYGVYLYAFPVQQLLVQFLPGISPLLLCGLACIITCGLAFLSWQFIEKPWLRRKLMSLPVAAAASCFSLE